MIFVGFRGDSVSDSSPIIQDIEKGRVGGIWLVDNDTPMGATYGNIVSPTQVRRLTQDLQAKARTPLFIGIDAEGGEVIRLKEKYGFPPTLSAEDLGRQDDLVLTRREARARARLLRSLGINMNFAPVVDLNKNPANRALGKKRRCFSADQDIVARHAAVFIEEHHAEGVFCVPKHFPGHGSAAEDTHLGFTDISRTWGEEELLPFRELIARGLADAVMIAHVSLGALESAHPATLSREIVAGLLRTRLGYEGVVISDDLNMGAISQKYSLEDAVRLSIDAGVDILLDGNVMKHELRVAEKISAPLLSLVRSGRISEDRITESFQRIMQLKARLA